MKTKVSELKGMALNWAVAKCEGQDFPPIPNAEGNGYFTFAPGYCQSWAEGGPIIEREEISVGHRYRYSDWVAGIDHKMLFSHGPTPLIAAMRRYVELKMGEMIDVPDELVD